MAAEHDEREGIRLSREGQAEAFAALVRQHQRMIHSLTYRMTGSVTDAEDLAQEAFVRAWQHLDSFQGDSRFSTWLCRIAMNACLNWRQREGRRTEVHQAWADNTLNDGGHPSHQTPDDNLNHHVQSALDRLSGSVRGIQALTAYRFGTIPDSDIAGQSHP